MPLSEFEFWQDRIRNLEKAPHPGIGNWLRKQPRERVGACPRPSAGREIAALVIIGFAVSDRHGVSRIAANEIDNPEQGTTRQISSPMVTPNPLANVVKSIAVKIIDGPFGSVDDEPATVRRWPITGLMDFGVREPERGPRLPE